MAELISREGNKVAFKVSVPAAEVNRAFEQVWAGLARDVKVPGFRPGKAPRKVIEGRVGKDYVEGQVRERLLDTHFQQGLRDLKLNLVDAQIDPQPVKSGQSFEFTVSGETYPEVKLGDWRSAQITAQAPEITDEVLGRTLSDLQERNASFEEVERPIEAADQVTVQELGEGDSADGNTYPVYLDVAEDYVRQALLGHQKGEVVEIEVPAHSHGENEHPAHTVRVRIESVRSKQLQELDDAFAASLNYDGIDKLRSDLRAELERRAQQEGENLRREELVEALVSGMEVEIPAALIERRRETMMNEIRDDLRRQGVEWSEYEEFMQGQGKLEGFMADLGKNAEARVRRDLALEQLAEDLGVQVSDNEFNQTLQALAQANQMTPQDLVRQIGQGGLNSYYTSMIREKGLQQALAHFSPKGAEAEAQAEGSQEQPTSDAQNETQAGEGADAEAPKGE